MVSDPKIIFVPQLRTIFTTLHSTLQTSSSKYNIMSSQSTQSNVTSASPYTSVEDYVKKCNGKRVIQRVLISNNGIGAVKAIRSMRKWSYEMFADDRAVKFIVMATPEDLRANAEYIRMGDECVQVPGGANNNNYANVSLIVQTAKQAHVDAVWPGWGHASENPALVDALVAANITFIGPPARPMRLLGDKIGSTIIAQSAKVPTIAWNGDGLEVDVADLVKGIPDEMYAKANVVTAEQCVECALRIGPPVMIKASEGGGGKGIRRVDVADKAALEVAFRQVQAEVPGSPIFVMKLSSGARHLEVQLLADEHGNAIALSGRDCSIQRRHQKIIEEGPPVACTVATPDVWVQMERAAVRLAKAVNYVNAGTVEYLYKDGEFFFLELNPRLQVEHPVTEMITGVNLPAAQLQVAMGVPLHNIADIRGIYVKDGKDEKEHGLVDEETGKSKDRMIDFDAQPTIPPLGHVIACRITAENPDTGFTPTSGAITELNFRSTPSVWGYFSVDSSGRVHEFADSQIGHLFAFGTTRNKARKDMILALKEISIRGDIRTTVEYLIKLLESPDFRSNNIDTTWLDARIRQDTKEREALVDANAMSGSTEEGRGGEIALDGRQRAALQTTLIGAACRAHMWATNNESQFVEALDRGQIPPKELVSMEDEFDMILHDVSYQVRVRLGGPNVYVLSVASQGVHARDQHARVAVRPLSNGGYLVMLDGKSYTAYIKNDATGMRLTVDGATHTFTNAYDPTRVVAVNSGKLVSYTVSDGDHVNAGQPFCEIEVMKMIMPLCAPESGHIHHEKTDGAILEPGDLIASMVLDDPSKVRQSTPFRGALPNYGDPWPTSASKVERPHIVLRSAMETLRDVLAGWQVPDPLVQQALRSMDTLVHDDRLCLLEFNEIMSNIETRLPAELRAALVNLRGDTTGGEEKKNKSSSSTTKFPVSELQSTIVEHCTTLPTRQADTLLELLRPLLDLSEAYRGGSDQHMTSLVVSLVSEYLEIEQPFSGRIPDTEVILRLRRQHTPNFKKVFEYALSHGQVERKNALLVCLLERCSISRKFDATSSSSSSSDGDSGSDQLHQASEVRLSKLLKSLAQLSESGRKYAPVTLKARQMLIQHHIPSWLERRSQFEEILSRAPLATGKRFDGDELTERSRHLSPLVEQPTPLLGLALTVLQSEVTDGLRSVAAEVYIRRIYHMYDLVSIEAFDSKQVQGASLLKFEFEKSKDDQQMLVKSGSSNDLSALLNNDGAASSSNEHSMDGVRTGVFATFETYQQLETSFDQLIDLCSGSDGKASQNVLHVAILDTAMGGKFNTDILLKPAEQRLADRIASVVTSAASRMEECGIRRVTFVVMHAPRGLEGGKDAKSIEYNFDYLRSSPVDAAEPETENKDPYDDDPGIFTFRRDLNFSEDQLIRDQEPTLAFRLELERMSNFNVNQVFSRNRAIHVYQATDKKDTRTSSRVPISHRFFVRALVRDDTVSLAIAVAQSKVVEAKKKMKELETQGETPSPQVMSEVLEQIVNKAHPGPEARFVDCLDALEVAIADLKPGSTVFGNHIFLNMLQSVLVKPEYVQQVCYQISQRYADRIRQLGVTSVEFRMDVKTSMDETAPTIPVRIIASNPTGYVLKVVTYVEVTDTDSGTTTFNVMTPEMMVRYEKFQESKEARSARSDSVSTPRGGNDGTTSPASQARRMVARRRSASDSSDYTTSSAFGSKNMTEEWMQGAKITTPYPVSNPIERNRQTASRITDTIYCYDLLPLLERAVGSSWRAAGRKRPKNKLFDAVELIMPEGTELVRDGPRRVLAETIRPPGRNNIGMVAWLVTMRTPEAPTTGRQMVLISNDITFKAGSFGTKEDELFMRATQYARERGLPRVYSAANSGARIGLASEVRDCFRVSWIDDEDASKGFEYLYLTPDDKERIEGSVATKRIVVPPIDGMSGDDEGEVRYVITDIIGAGLDLGVENLKGSGMIAGETSRAYRDIFTLTYVTGRCVGIGAYLVRLGQRTIQKETSAPILLTGYQALNKLMGKAVYTSNSQLGGPDIMYSNGVSHSIVSDDYQGVREILKWLSYVPIKKEGPLPILAPSDLGDTPDRSIEVEPTSKVATDPRILLAGFMRAAASGDGFQSTEWVSGFFDRDSFHETMAGWAKTVVTGRARLGGIPIGVIITEERTMQKTAPADPAAPTSTEVVSNQAGQVWFPDSAHKTATAINDFSGEDLPLIIFANWRGFSGGQRDMYDEVLKFGALIVDALVGYKHPVFVYLPPYSTLRGGAWAVLDPTINGEVMEMYADPRSRGGVLEPAGIVAIKYRRPDLIKSANRLDHVLRSLNLQLSVAKRSGNQDLATNIGEQITQRQKQVLGMYQQIATHFADLHDTPGRMEAKEVIHGTVPWRRARSFFYWRLRRRLAEFALRKYVMEQVQEKTMTECSALIKEWFVESQLKTKPTTSAQPTWKQYAFSGNSFAQAGSNVGGEGGSTSQTNEDMR